MAEAADEVYASATTATGVKHDVRHIYDGVVNIPPIAGGGWTGYCATTRTATHVDGATSGPYYASTGNSKAKVTNAVAVQIGSWMIDGKCGRLAQKPQLTGQIDVNALVPLRSLRTISLMNNSFEGSMPEWKKLGALKSLFLSNNHFSGQIPPDAFKGMASLKKVYLANNRFTGNIPVTLATPRLLELRLENNQFTGPIPDLKPSLKVSKR
ncbi:pollen receptor-like kinase 1 [Coffea eugenioides]|uniref:pollen receptor-like kinase 1 n=1 Tax=Coffea eugenioides TaxID=49369 RepID=UPI000F60E832|nr:pollen receptor-like kinase 1 [Coffea eugenioides]